MKRSHQLKKSLIAQSKIVDNELELKRVKQERILEEEKLASQRALKQERARLREAKTANVKDGVKKIMRGISKAKKRLDQIGEKNKPNPIYFGGSRIGPFNKN